MIYGKQERRTWRKLHIAINADGAYISKNCFDAIAGTGGGASIALRSGTGMEKIIWTSQTITR